MKTVRTACTYDCPDACGLRVTRDGEWVVVQGDPDHPITRGTVCPRSRRHPERLRDPERLPRPRLRGAAGWRDVSWDEALGVATERLGTALAEHGAPSVVYARGGGSLGIGKALIGHFFQSLGAITTVRGGPCGDAGEAAQTRDFGLAACHDYTDLAQSAAVVLWGKNPVATGRHLVPFLKEARCRGAPLLLVEPRHTETTPLADRVIRVAPGGDGHLALAVLALLHRRGALDRAAQERVENLADHEALLRAVDIDEYARRAGTPRADVEALAQLYAERHPTATLIGWGLQRRRQGGLAVRHIDALALLSGNMGVPGGGASYTSKRTRGLDTSILARPSGRTIGAATFGRDLAALRDPPARFVYIALANPVTQLTDSRAIAAALRATDFVVVADAFFTDTAAAADLVLPPVLMLEEDDRVGSYGHHWVTPARRALPPPSGARTDVWIVGELCRRLGRQDPLLEDPAAALDRLTAPWFAGEPPDGPRRNPAQPELPFADRFRTPTGRAFLATEVPRPPERDPRYPLSLMTPSVRRWQCSQIPEREQSEPVRCTVHPEAAADAGVRDGAPARLRSRLDTLEVIVHCDARQDPCLATVPKGGWLRHGRCSNALVEAQATDLGDGVVFYGQPVRLERLD
ncbi:MAG: molybdopterin-dependent oxidoreductase [bacterium]